MATAARDLQGQAQNPSATYRLAVRLACVNIEGADSVGLSMVRRGHGVETVAATNEMAVTADGLQYKLGQGPCLEAIWDEHTVYAPNVGVDARWPTWGPRVVDETEASCVLAFQLFTHDDTLGALNIYSKRVDAFDDDARHEGSVLAAHIAVAVAAARQIGQLTQGLDSRSVIGQATGIVMGRFNVDADVAFKVLARYSSTSNTKLRDVAEEVVRTRVLPRTSTPKAD